MAKRPARWLLPIAIAALLMVGLAGAAAVWAYIFSVPGPELSHRVLATGTRAGLLKEVGRDAALLARVRKLSRHATPAGIEGATAPLRPLLQRIRGTLAEEGVWARMYSAVERQQLEDCARAFAAEGRLALAGGDARAALDQALDAIELGKSICPEGTVSERVTGQQCQSLGIELAQACLSRLSGPNLLPRLARVRRLRLGWTPIAETVEHDRWSAREACRRELLRLSSLPIAAQVEALHDETRVGAPVTVWNDDTPLLSAEGWAAFLTPRRRILEEVDGAYRTFAKAASRPAPKGVPEPRVSHPLARRHLQFWATGCYRGEWPRNNLAILETALAVRIHHLERGAYPANLQELVPRLLPEIPHDVWDQPIAYQPRAGRPCVYSIGADGIDDSGRPVDPRKVILAAKGDLVFGKLCDTDWPASSGASGSSR
jgi:hypothetical protein